MAKREHKPQGYIKPAGMSKKMAEEVLAGNICGAKRCNQPGTEDKHFCHGHPSPVAREKRPHPPYRCHRHGGAVKNRVLFQPGHKVNTQHGIYTDAVLPGEEEFYATLQAGNVDEEIKMCKLRLRRAMIMETRQRALLEKGKEGDKELKESMHLHESSRKVFVEKVGDGTEDEKGKKKEKIQKSKTEASEVRKNVDYSRAVKDISNEIYKFEQIRTLQMQASSGETVQEQAKRVQEEIDKIRASIEVVSIEAVDIDGEAAGESGEEAAGEAGEAAETQEHEAGQSKIGPFEKGAGGGGGES